MSPNSLFREGENCWRQSQASFVTPLIDCRNYYRALHEAIRRAKHSVFIIGWDIDSRIQLLRGADAEETDAPSVISDLIAWKAERDPHVQFYLLRWDSSLAFLSRRELWAQEVWEEKTPDNVHIVLDDTIPMGGSQHQKIVLIDDEIVFTGGMDIAINRWDTRDHRPHEPERFGPEGEYEPLHDVQVLCSGPVVEHFAELVRWRWCRLSSLEPVVCLQAQADDSRYSLTPKSWPRYYPPLLKDIPCAIARTIPFMDDVEPAQEVRHMLLDLIARAENFLYIENQFASREEIAEAINARLKACKSLKVLIVSSYAPKGTVECEAYWAGRIDFKKILENGIQRKRVRIVYSSIGNPEEDGLFKRVHAKVMVVDDRYLVIGSSNLSNRSMTLDTECDLIFSATKDDHAAAIAHIRNDLLAEHTGHSEEEVAKILTMRNPIRHLMKPASNADYALHEVNDEQFTDKSLQTMFRTLSDPEVPIIPTINYSRGKRFYFPNPRKKTLLFSAAFMVVAVLLCTVYLMTQTVPWLDPEHWKAFLDNTRGTFWSLPAVVLIYVVGGLVFFPVTVMSLAVAAVFGPVWGVVFGMTGALVSAAMMFVAGHLLGDQGLRKLAGSKVQKVDDKFKQSGVVGVASIRLIPIAPYSLVNLVAGISSIGFTPFILGTFLGMLPPMIAKGMVGDSLTTIFMNPSVSSVSYLLLGILGWVLIVVASQRAVRYLQDRKQDKQCPQQQPCNEH